MADNNFNPNNDLSQFYQRSNKLANESNSMKIKVDGCYCCDDLELVGDFVIDSGAGTVTFTAGAPTSAYDVRYFQLFIQDESGNSASNTVEGTALAAPVVVDVATLDSSDSWYITIYFSNDKEVVLGNDCKTFGEIKVTTPAADPTVTVNTVLLDAQIINVFEADGSTPVANGGAAVALGDFSAGGGSEAANFVIKNAGGTVLTISDISFTSDVDGVVTAVPNYVYVAGELVVDFTVDTSGGAGAKTGSLIITSNDPATPSYVVNIAFNLV